MRGFVTFHERNALGLELRLIGGYTLVSGTGDGMAEVARARMASPAMKVPPIPGGCAGALSGLFSRYFRWQERTGDE